MGAQRFLGLVRVALTALTVLGSAQAALAQSALEQVTGGGPANAVSGQTLTTITTSLQNNTNNPTGNTFASPGFTPTVTYTLSAQQYTAPAAVVSSGVATVFGGPNNGSASIFYGPLSGIGAPSNGNFTSTAAVPTGTGIDTTLNFGARMYIALEGLQQNGAPLSGRLRMADLTLTYSAPVTNPVIHLSGLGGSISSGSTVKGFSAEFEFLNLAANNITSVSRLSGNAAFVQSGNNFNNSNANPNASCSANEGACGSVLVTGTGITQIQLRVYLRSTTVSPGSGLAWNTAGTTSGDAFYVSTSFELSDMQPAFSNLPASIAPGTTYTGLTLTCTNNGPNFARGGVFCTPAASEGTVSNLVCTPALPADITNVAPDNRAICTFDYTLPPSSTATSVTLTGQTGAGNDRNGGSVGTAGNNQTQQTLSVVPSGDLAITKTNGATSVSAGGTTTYTVRVTNNGPSTITGAILSDPASTGLTKTAVACSATPGQCTTAPSVTQLQGSSFALPALASGQFYEITISANVTATSGSVTNLATVAAPAGSTDPTPGNNSASDTDSVTPTADLSVTKTDGLTRVGSTGSITYRVRVTNAGPSAVTGAILSDPVAPGLSKTTVACSGTPGQCTSAPTVAQLEGGSFALPALASGAFYEITVTATVTATSGSVANTATVTAPGGTTDPAPGNNMATDTNVVYVIDAVDDDRTGTPVNGASGGTLASVLGNDTLDSLAVVASQITLTPGTAPTPAGGSITMNPDGTITVAAGTTAGVYTYAYRICEILYPTNCDTATATLVVDAAPIDAVDDSGAVANGASGGTAVANVLVNDTLNGAPATLATTTLAQLATTNPNVTLNPATGAVSVAPGTPAGIYEVTYELCEILNPTNCDVATVSVAVGAAPIDAVSDSGTVANGLNGGTAVANVLTNDTLNGVPATLATVVVSQTATTNPNVTLDPASGAVNVAPGTPAGTYTVTYQICEQLNPINCDTATVSVTVGAAPIDAVADTGTVANGLNGGTAVPNVLVNDTLNGAPATLANVTLIQVATTNPNVTLDPASGAVNVAPGTPAGTYTVTYQICEQLNPTNCDTTIVTTTVGAAPIDAVADTGTVANGLTGGTAVPNVLVNDTLNGVPATLANIALTQVATTNPNVTLDPATGAVNVAPGTPAGTYTVTYRICEQLNPTNCDTTTVITTVGAAPIDAVDDAPPAVGGIAGGILSTVLGNDSLNGTAATVGTGGNVTLTPGAAPTPASGSITMNSDGTITVAAGTTAGTYAYAYTICEILNPTNCDTATATVVVLAAPIDAVDDSPVAVNGYVGGTTPTVLGNDTLAALPVDPAAVLLIPGAPPAPAAGSITMNPDGTITVAAGTTAGTYAYSYTICERTNPTNCDTATASVVVAPPVILAEDNDFSATPLNGFVGGVAGNVLTNDRLNGATVNPAQTTITVVDADGIAGLAISDSGVMTVPAGTPAGTYTVEYRLCEDLNPGNCDTALVTLQINPPVIDAVNDDFTATALNGFTGGTAGNVLTNDRLNGATVNPALTTITVTDPGGLTGVAIADSGTISVPAGTPAGTYTVTYRLCEDLNPGNCDTATVLVRVTPPVINAVDNSFPSISGLSGGTTASVLGNDTLNGAPIVPAQITLTPGTAPTPASGSIAMNSDGTISVAAGTTAGTYAYPYTICEVVNPTNCDTATATVVVGLPAIDARPEVSPTFSGIAPPGLVMNVLTSDRIGGLQATTSNVSISLVSILTAGGAPYPELTLDTATGNVDMSVPGPGGIVLVTYRICDLANPTNCDTQVETLAILPLVLEALPEAYDPVNGLIGGTLTVGGLPATIIDSDIVDSTDATLVSGSPNSVVIPAPVASDYTNLATDLPVTFLSLDPATGIVTVAPNTPAGSYGIFYEICDPLDLTRCDGITETLVVTAAPIDAVADDLGPVNGFAGGTTGSVLGNDTLNGLPVDPATVTLTPGAALNPVPAFGSITLNPDGTVTVAPGTSAGIYEYSYTICEILNPTNCDSTTITIRVAPPVIDAVSDTPPPVNGFTGGTLPSVLGNDTLNGAAVDPADVLYVPGAPVGPTPAAGSITLNPDGTVTVAAGTTAGSYDYSYTICDRVNPLSCDTSTVTVVVTPAPIDAVDDDYSATPVIGASRGALSTVLTNDTLNGVAVDPADITLAPGTAPTPAAGSVTMNPDGTISVAAGTTAGTYSYPYTICEILNPGNCDTATATVVVLPAPIDAVDDTGSVASGAAGGTAVPNVLVNDTLNAAPATLATVSLAQVATTDPNVTLDPATGAVSVAPATPAGTYTVTYRICERLNPANCDTATATVTVGAAVIDAVADTGSVASGATGGTAVPNVLANDTLGGSPATLATVSLTQTATTSPNVTLDPATGAVAVAPATPAGTYTVTYQICERLNPTNCDTTTVSVTVGASVIDAVDDAPAAINGFVGGSTATVLGNDTLGGLPFAPAAVTLVPGPAPTPTVGSITMNPDGTITVAAGTTAGSYSYPYTICEVLNPTNCDTATATVIVAPPVIDAVDDDFSATPVNGLTGGPAGNVLGNDTLNGDPVDPALITIAVTSNGGLSGAFLTPTGDLVIPPDTPASTYSLIYEICEVLNPTNCDVALITVVIDPAPIDAVDDAPAAINGLTGGATGTVLANDTLNGVAVDPAAIILTPGPAPTPATGSITMNPDGTITVAAGTTAGSYPYTYEICEVMNPANCDTATATVVVGAAVIDAVDDASATISGITGGATGTVLANDTLNGVAVDPAAITLTPGAAPTPAAGSITMNPDGTITVAAGTTAGSYPYTYEICEILNPANCDTATATVVVGAAVIDAVDDAPAAVSAALGGSTASVLGNDTLNGAPVDAAAITLTPGSAPTPATGSITMNPDGTITVAAGTTSGTYSYPYTICEALNPANCDTATATVVVESAGVTELVDDISRGNIPGTAVTIRVLGNDRDPNGVFDPSTLQILGTSAPGEPLVVPGEGVWTVDLVNGTITFTPEPGFQGDPTPIRYQIADLSGVLLEPAFVIITYDLTPAFVCSDVIGKVFDDANHDGYQDPGEMGIPGARLATVDGRIITTDEHGRFSVPCAAIPQDIGSTFLLKLDPRSLPTGYRVTTENPRTVRLTQGMMSKMNFGVSLTNLVRVDLTAEAFDPQTGEIGKDLDKGLKALVKSVARKPSFVRLSYFVDGETTDLAEDRLKLVEDRLRDLWRDRGRGKLGLETTVIEKN